MACKVARRSLCGVAIEKLNCCAILRGMAVLILAEIQSGGHYQNHIFPCRGKYTIPTSACLTKSTFFVKIKQARQTVFCQKNAFQKGTKPLWLM